MTPATRNDRLLMCMPYRQFVRKAAAEGFRTYSIWDPDLESAAYLDEVAALSEELALADFRDEAGLRRVVAEAAARHDVAHVLHFGREETQSPVCEQADALGLAVNPPRSLEQINDKAAMRRLLRERGLSPVRAVEAASPQEAQRILEAGHELPVVVKPTGLDGSRGVRLIERAGDAPAGAAALDADGYRGAVLVEEVLRGPEFSVETLTTGGRRHHVVGITAKRLGPPPGFVEMGHVYPAPLPEADRATIAELVVAFLDATGYRFGPTHTEVILTARGPRIVESQARLGGDRIPQLVEVASGFDIEAALFRALAGGPVEPGPAQRLGCISFFDLGSGRVRSIGGAEAIRRLPFVHALKLKVGPGDVLRPVTDSQSRHGYVVIDAASEEQAQERFGAVRALLQVVTHPESED